MTRDVGHPGTGGGLGRRRVIDTTELASTTIGTCVPFLLTAHATTYIPQISLLSPLPADCELTLPGGGGRARHTGRQWQGGPRQRVHKPRPSPWRRSRTSSRTGPCSRAACTLDPRWAAAVRWRHSPQASCCRQNGAAMLVPGAVVASLSSHLGLGSAVKDVGVPRWSAGAAGLRTTWAWFPAADNAPLRCAHRLLTAFAESC